MTIELASDNIVDPVVNGSSPDDSTSATATRTPPPQYGVLRAGSTQLERFHAASDEEALSRLQREVRAGQAPVIWCYKLWVSEEFVPSSRTTFYQNGSPAQDPT